MHDVPEFAGGAKWDSEPVLQHYDDDVKYDSREPLPELGRDIQAILVDKVLAIRGIVAAAAADDTCGMIARDYVSTVNGRYNLFDDVNVACTIVRS